ncbi:DUF945 family protein [Pontibacterium sp. N1Y112]|uniref:DUF945 family protein n=1 Tax=Pontibacterium sinense TaxID=2781979 RepID=A0A8J7FEI7_9GAMM|nr:DUF945 family protein [Pontibacterium sinense]MBE9398617.1 DUF945 family protein [Pontibacterium sinense]
MKNVVIPVVLVGVAAAGAASIKYTGDQAHESMVAFVDQVNQAPNYQGVLKVELQSERSFIENSYRLELVLQDPEITEALSLERIPFDIRVKNSVLSAQYITQIAPGELLDQIKATQANPAKPAIQFLADASFNPFDQTLAIDHTLMTDTFSIKQKDTEVVIGALESTGSLDGDQITGEGQMGSLTVSSTGEEVLKMSGVTMTQSGTLVPGSSYMEGLFAEFTADMKLREFWFNAQNKQMQVTLNDLGFEIRQTEKEERLLLDVVNSMGDMELSSAVEASPVNLSSAKLDMTFDVNNAAFKTLTQQINEMPAAQRQNPFVMMGLMGGLTAQGINLNLNALNVQTDKGVLVADGSVQVAAFDLMRSMQDPNAIREKLDGNFKFSVDETLVNALPDQQPRNQLNQFAKHGLVKKEGGKIVTEVNVVKGQITVNGIPMG